MSKLRNMIVRKVRPKEYAEVGRITADAYRDFYPREDRLWQDYVNHIGDVKGRAAHTLVLVAVEGKEILGSVTLELDHSVEKDREVPEDTAHIRMLGVKMDSQGKGVGRALTIACIEAARKHGKKKLTLYTMPPMLAAQKLYESLGFHRDEERDRKTSSGVTLKAYGMAL